MLCYVMLCYVMLCYVMLCYVMLCYVMLCYIFSLNIAQSWTQLKYYNVPVRHILRDGETSARSEYLLWYKVHSLCSYNRTY